MYIHHSKLFIEVLPLCWWFSLQLWRQHWVREKGKCSHWALLDRPRRWVYGAEYRVACLACRAFRLLAAALTWDDQSLASSNPLSFPASNSEHASCKQNRRCCRSKSIARIAISADIIVNEKRNIPRKIEIEIDSRPQFSPKQQLDTRSKHVLSFQISSGLHPL